MTKLISVVVIAFALAGCATAPADTRSAPQLTLKEFGSFHIGGRDVKITGKANPDVTLTRGIPSNIDVNGTYTIEQMYVQYFIPAKQRGRYPLLLWHGAWLTGATYETTPDGRPGWLHYFLNQGWATYNSDAVERGRAGWSPDAFTPNPISLTKENGFERFRIGQGKGSYDPALAKRRVPPGALFPIEAYDQFVKQAVPRWTTNNKATITAYVELVDKVCPCVVLVHSQSGLFGAAVAEARPDKVKALVMVEPANGGEQAANLKNTPVLAMWGDYVEQDPRWSQIRKVVNGYYDAVRAAGGTVDMIDLPQSGIHGNSHMIMMDKNSDQVAGLIQDWLTKKKLWE